MDDFRKQLGNIRKDIENNMTDEEKRKLKEEKNREYQNRQKFRKSIPGVYEFMAGYKHNSGIFINNFMRNRSFEMYEEDKFGIFDFDISGMLPNVFDNPILSMQMVEYLKTLDENKIAYHPIDVAYVIRLLMLSEALKYGKKTEEDLTLYRGCSTLERNGVNGIVSTTRNKDIALQFSRGSILTIHLPKGSSYIDIKNIRPKEQRKQDKEDEVILPPCDYEILESEVKAKNREPNNYHNETNHIILKVKERDFLKDFYERMENMPEEYKKIIYPIQKEEYEEAKIMVKRYIDEENNKRF